jgi:cysteine synthase A
MTGAIQKANEIQRTTPNSVIASQFENPSNPQAHYETTGPEIYQNMQTRVDFFVCGVGTGGTLTGVAKYLKEQNKGTKVIAVEPYNSAVISGEKAGPHGLQGIGAGFIPDVLDTSLIDMVIKVRDEDAFKMTREVYDIEGVMAGISIKPGTDVSEVFPLLEECDMVLVMTVEPGYGGQKLIPETLEKVSKIRAEIENRSLSVEIQVDGGINSSNAPMAISAGASILVAGSSVFGAADKKAAIESLRNAN